MSSFIDTNILVYAHDAGAGERHEVAKSLMQRLWTAEPLPSISVQVLQELYVNLLRKKLDADNVRLVVRTYMALPVIPNDMELLAAGVAASQRWQVSLWDALIIEAARRAGAAELLTEDLNDGQDFDGVRVVNPFRG